MSGEATVVLAAMPRELRLLVRALRLHRSPLRGMPAWRDDRVLAVAVGVGPARAGAGAAVVLEETSTHRLLVTGVAGAVDPALGVADVLRPATVVDARTGATFVPRAATQGRGVLVTVDSLPAGRPGDAGTDGTVLPADATAVDMETAAIAAAADLRGVPWDVVRAISDGAGTLTPAVAAILRPDGRADLRAAVRLLAREPLAAGRFVRLGIGSARAVRAATGAVLCDLETARFEGRAHPGLE